MDLFDKKKISPMLLYSSQPFDDENYIYELKLDGIRCIAYIDTKSVVLQNKRHKDITELYPELANMRKCVNERVILDGELIVLTDGKPDFYSLQQRSLLTDAFKISLMTKLKPVYFVAYDILYYAGKDVTALPLIERKKYLSEKVTEGNNLTLSRYIEKEGTKFFSLAEKQELEGIVAKKKDGVYLIGKRSRNWLKIKVLQEEDLFIFGYKKTPSGGVGQIIVGCYKNGKPVNRGKISLGVSIQEKKLIKDFSLLNRVDEEYFPNLKNVIWLKPKLKTTIRYMAKTESGGMRQPVWKGIKTD